MLLSRFSMSRRLTRERLMSVDDADRPEANKLEFDDEDLEKSWRREGMLLNMKSVAQLLEQSACMFHALHGALEDGQSAKPLDT
eukprot:s4259_g4.t1